MRNRMTKAEIIEEIFKIITSDEVRINDQVLLNLYENKRISYWECISHESNNWYGTVQLMKLSDRARKNKNYRPTLHSKKWFNYWYYLKNVEEEKEKAEKFIENAMGR